MTYARARLAVGMGAVGTVVLTSACALSLGLPGRYLPSWPAGPAVDAAALLAVAVLHALLLAPFDLLGGHLLPRRYGRSRAGLGRFLFAWARGVSRQIAIVLATSLVILTIGRLAGPWGAAVAFAAAMAVLVWSQPGIAAWVGGIRRGRASIDFSRVMLARRGIRHPATVVVESGDPGFSGGIVGWPRRERLLVPAGWIETLGAEGIAAELARWSGAIRNGSRRRGLLVAGAWNLAGFVLALQWPGADVVSVAGWVTLVLAFTLWSFLGLLVLPSVSRPAVLAADACGVLRSEGTAVLEQTMTRLDRLQDDEPERSAWVETLFHPIPSLRRRVRRLREGGLPGWTGAWHAARTALFLSWAGMGLLSRAVHCNSGRPELWSMPPCD